LVNREEGLNEVHHGIVQFFDSQEVHHLDVFVEACVLGINGLSPLWKQDPEGRLDFRDNLGICFVSPEKVYPN